MSEKADDIFHLLTKERQSEPSHTVNESNEYSVSKGLKSYGQLNRTMMGKLTNPPVSHERKVFREMIKPRTVGQVIDPSDANYFEEQLELISEGLVTNISKNHMNSALSFTMSWLDGIIDEDNKMFNEVRESLSSLSKDELINYLEVVLSSMK